MAGKDAVQIAPGTANVVPAKFTPVAPTPDAAGTLPEKRRFLPLDAYRGLIMILLVSEGFGFGELTNHPVYGAIANQFHHRPWGGAVFYDLIMPAFLFMMGVAMPFSLGRRMEQGADKRQLFKHVAKRSLSLVIISWILISIESKHPHIQFHNVLIVVAFTSFVCFFLMQLDFRYQAGVAFGLLVFHSALYLLFPGPDGAFRPFNNLGAVLDRASMGRTYFMPAFLYYHAPYVNLNLIPEISTVLFGVWAGNLIRSPRPRAQQLRILTGGMIAAFALGLLISPVVPINKWLWTASYALYTTGWSILGLLLFYVLVEVFGVRRPMFLLTVVGMNSLLVYGVGEILRGWINTSVMVFTGGFKFVGTLAPVVQSCVVLCIIWYLTYWLYQRKVFLRV
jgi:heparan-alpha-glucosaminide N-acetyltransferase